MRSLKSWLKKWINDDELLPNRISYSEALTLPPLWYALLKICEDAGQLPLDIKKETEYGLETDFRHPAYKLLRDQSNRFQTPDVFKTQVTGHAIMYGNGRAAVLRDATGNPVELIPLLPDRTWTFILNGEKIHVTKPEKENDKDVTISLKTNANGYVAFDDTDVIHVQGFSYDGIEGIGLLQIGQTAMSAGVNAGKFYDNQIKRGFRGKLFLEAPPGKFRDYADAKQFVDEFNKKEGGSDNAHKAAMLRDGMKAVAVTMTNNDAQFESLAKFNRSDIGLLFGLDSIPGDGVPKNYNSLEQYNLMYGRALDRWLCKWELQCDMKLRSDVQKIRRSHYFKFNRAAIYRTDLATTVTSLCNLLTHTVISPNEAREKLDMTKRENGDEYVNPATTAYGDSQGQSEQSQDDSQTSEKESQSSRAVETMLRGLIATEANNAVRGSRSKNFLEWIDRNYSKWEPKFAEKLEAIGMDRDLARTHCEESKNQLLDVAGQSTPENLEQNVRTIAESWPNRTYSLMGVNRDPLQN
jgi:HK97 family phage portal protein